MSEISLRCPFCQSLKLYPRETDPSLPANVATIEIVCPACDDGDFHTETWFDAAGGEISQDVTHPIPISLP